MKETTNYNYISTSLKYFELLLKQLESENKNCENIDIILNSQIAGIVQEKIDRDIITKDLRDYEREDLTNQFSDLKDYFSDIQVRFEMGCKCNKTTKGERDEIYKRHEKKVLEREGIEYVEKAYETAKSQLIEKKMRERGR